MDPRISLAMQTSLSHGLQARETPSQIKKTNGCSLKNNTQRYPLDSLPTLTHACTLAHIHITSPHQHLHTQNPEENTRAWRSEQPL